jgi:hypothetical protein
MQRYHIKTGFKPDDILRLKEFTNKLNHLVWSYTGHCLDNLKYRAIDIEAVLRFIKGAKLDYSYIFEYYSNDDKIIKVCYRIKYNNGIDLILVIGEHKQIITIYYNSNNDNHLTLKKYIYSRP